MLEVALLRSNPQCLLCVYLERQNVRDQDWKRVYGSLACTEVRKVFFTPHGVSISIEGTRTTAMISKATVDVQAYCFNNPVRSHCCSRNPTVKSVHIVAEMCWMTRQTDLKGLLCIVKTMWEATWWQMWRNVTIMTWEQVVEKEACRLNK